MTILSATEKKSVKGRLLMAAIYALLAIGSLTMIYPFALMLAGATKSGVDAWSNDLIPAFLHNDEALFAKYAEGHFNESILMMRMTLQNDASSFRTLVPLPPGESAAMLERWRDFLDNTPQPPHASQAAFIHTPASRGAQPHNLRAFKQTLARHTGRDIARLNRTYGVDFHSWNTVFIIPMNYLSKRALPDDTPLASAYAQFVQSLPGDERYGFSVEGYFRQAFLRAAYPPGDIAAYNTAHGTHHPDWRAIPLPRAFPASAPERVRRDWLIFVRELLNPLWITATPEAASHYRRYLRARHQTIETLNRLYRTEYAAFDDVPLPDAPRTSARPPPPACLADWSAWISGWQDPDTREKHILDEHHILLDTTEHRFRDYLRDRFGNDLPDLNRKLWTAFTDWSRIHPPVLAALSDAFHRQKARLRHEFLWRNYLSAIEYILLHGRALFNTLIYCALSILLALLVNPLAAYALSRYRPPAAYLILLFLMLTMAFPPMVTQIPVFLMLREFNLLNTFWALILPGMANGYSIFLLKGFFDSLPRDLYDSAALDGAGELTIFWHITMSLSKPILAVIALNAFTLAYTNFMMALLICQDERMWTIMPWLYQLQQNSGPGVIFASLILAAIPTLLVFAFCQNIILRGIVIPVEK